VKLSQPLESRLKDCETFLKASFNMGRKREIFLVCFAFILWQGSVFGQATYTENSDIQFNAGTYNSTSLLGSGSEAEVFLDHYGSGQGLNIPGNGIWLNSSWKYRRPIVLTSSHPSTLTDYNILADIDTQSLISAGRMNADGSDLRFATSTVSGTPQSLPYYIESGINTLSTKIWIKVPAVAAGSTTLHMYYGNVSANVASDETTTFTLGDDFNEPNGSSPSTYTWVSIQSAEPVSGSVRDIQNNRLRLRFGSQLGSNYYGLRSVQQQLVSSGKLYHFEINASAMDNNAWSHITLCPTLYSYSDHEENFLRFSINHTADGPVYTLKRKDYDVETTLVSATSLPAAFHKVDFLITPSSITVLLDGSQIYSGANDLSFDAPYIYLEGESASSSLEDFLFDYVYVRPYVPPEPGTGSIQEEEGKYYSSGTFTSQVKNTGADDSRVVNINWDALVSTDTALSFEMRGDNADVNLATFTTVYKDSGTDISGKYLQYRIIFNSTNPIYTPRVSTVSVTYLSPPTLPESFSGQPKSISSILWSWLDNSSGQYQEDGFSILDSSDAEVQSLAADTTYWLETGLNANTPYSRKNRAYNVAGSSSSEIVSVYTFPVAPNVNCDKSTDTWYGGDDTNNCNNQVAFGENGVEYYKYVWNSSSQPYSWGGGEPAWGSGILQYLPGSSNLYYLHLRSFNGDDVAGDTAIYGPYLYDVDSPSVMSFSPASIDWYNTGISVDVYATDSGGSNLSRIRYRWTTTTERPTTGWSSWDSSIYDASASTSPFTIATSGQWYLHIEVEDIAGNSGYNYSGQYRIDTAKPSGSVSINSGDAYTASVNVTLSLTYSDSLSGVKEVRYKNFPGGDWSAAEPPQDTKSWTLTSGAGDKTVAYEVVDNAGNSQIFYDSIILDPQTNINAQDVIANCSGTMGEVPNDFETKAVLTWAVDGSPLVGKTIEFFFIDSTHTAITDSYGVAVSTFEVPSSSGVYVYNASFSGDGTYSQSQSTSSLTAEQRPVSLTAYDVNASASSDFTAQAVLKDKETGNFIVGSTITFVFEGSTRTAITDDVGVATVTFTAPSSTDTYYYSALFEGDATYASKATNATVGVGLKVTTLVLSNVSPIANSTFTAQATLMDGATPISSETITFTFLGSTKTAVTSDVGIATVSFIAPSSSGTYSYNGEYDGSSIYAPSSNSADVDVSQRSVSLVGDQPNGYVDATFDIQATLSDGTSGDKIGGKAIYFEFEGSSQTAITDVTGIATATFNSGSLVRQTSYYISFSGDETYGFADSSGTVSIIKRPSSLAGSSLEVIKMSSFTATAELKDVAFAPTPVSGKTITFDFMGTTRTASTSETGIATVTFQAGYSTGTYEYTVSFEEDAKYLASSGTATVTITLRPATLIPYERYTYTLDEISLVADLQDGISSDGIGDVLLDFTFNDILKTTFTVASGSLEGRGYAVYDGTPVAGDYDYYVVFNGNSDYEAVNGTSTVHVTQRPINLAAYPVETVWGSTFSVSAELTDNIKGTPIEGKNLRFSMTGAETYALTDASGIAVATFPAISSTGTINYVADFPGDQTYKSGSSTSTIDVLQRPCDLITFPVNKYVGDSIYLSATMQETTEEPIVGKPVEFYFEGSTLTASTNGSGVATAGPFSAVSSSGTYAYTASFQGDEEYLSRTSSSTLTALQRPIVIELNDITAVALSTFSMTARLKDKNTSNSITLATITFTLQSSTYSLQDITDGSGMAKVVYAATSTTGVYDYSATFDGDEVYQAGSSTKTVTVITRPTYLETSNVSTTANSTFTLTVVLKDNETGETLANENVSFYFLGSTKTVLTDALGSGATTFVAPSSTDTYTFTVTFSGDSLYAPSNKTKNVVVGQRNAQILTSDVSAVAMDTFTVVATLKDFDEGYAIEGATISFTFSGSTSTYTDITDSEGNASAVFIAPDSTGTYSYTAVFEGSELYGGNSNISSVFVNRREVSIKVYDLTSIVAGSSFTATAEITDKSFGTFLEARTLTFTFESSTSSAVSDSNGISSTTFTAPLSTGTYNYYANFAGDTLYKPGNGVGNVKVVLRPTVLEVLDVDDAVVGLVFEGTAKLRDIELGNALVESTETITFTFSTATVDSLTDGGVAIATFTAPTSTGTYYYSASFAGSDLYGASSGTGTVIVGRRPVLFALSSNPEEPYTFRPEAESSSFTLKAVLSDGKVAGLNLEGRTIRFIFQGSTQTAVTNSLGIATVTYNSPVSSGTYYYYGYFDGDESYNPNNPEDSEKIMLVVPRPTYILSPFPSNGSVVAGTHDYVHTINNYNARGIIKDTLSNQGIEGMTLSFYILGSTRTGTSDSNGTANSSSVFPYVVEQGVYSATITFSGNATYASSVLPGGTDLGNPDEGKIRVSWRPAFFDLPETTEAYPDEDKVISGKLRDWWSNATADTYLIGYSFSYRICSRACEGACDSGDVSACSGYWSAWSNGVVAANNVANATVHTPPAAGDYPLGYTFSNTPTFYHHNPWGTYPRFVRVGRRLTTIIAESEPFTVGAQQPIDIAVKLVDLTQDQIGIDGKDLNIVLITTQTVVTGSGGAPGKVVATFSGLDVGTYTYTAEFPDGDPEYMPYTSTGTVVVEKNQTIIRGEDTTVPAGGVFVSTATLTFLDNGEEKPVEGKTVNFVFYGTSTVYDSAVTNSLGVATVSFNAPWSTGLYVSSCSFAGDASYSASSDTDSVVNVRKRVTVTTAENGSVYILENFISTATLTDSDNGGAGIGGKTISFVFHGDSEMTDSAVTADAGNIGVATVVFPSPGSSGSYDYSATFPGDSVYAISSDTKTIAVLKRISEVSGSGLTAPTNSTFTLTAILQDVTHSLGVSTPIAGANIEFIFNGGDPVYGTTDEMGQASATVTAPSVAGTYYYTASFAGDQTYKSDITNPIAITVRKRNTIVSGTDVLSVAAGAEFTAEAELIDEFGEKLPDYLITFVFTGTGTFTGSGVTDVLGVATTTFTAPLSTGTYNYTASFAGDDTYEASSDDTNAVEVNVASTTLSIPDYVVTVNDVLSASATLKGKESGVGIADKQVGFTYDGVFLDSSTTDSEGVAIWSFSPNSTGTYQLDVAFAGDDAFYASSASCTVTVERRAVELILDDATTKVAPNTFIATATLHDVFEDPPVPIEGREIAFLFDGTESAYAYTNALGIATVTYTAPSSSGSYILTADFAGDEIYLSTSAAAYVSVEKMDTSIVLPDLSSLALEVFTATATLMDELGSTISLRSIDFTYQSSSDTQVTDSNGDAFSSFNAGEISGPWELDGVFDGSADDRYNSSSASATVTVLKRDCYTAPENSLLKTYEGFIATTTLYDAHSLQTISTKSVSFVFSWNPTTFTATSDAAGKAYYSYTAPIASGTYELKTYFVGDDTYNPSPYSTSTLTVERRPTDISLKDVTEIFGRTFITTATLKSEGALISAKPVRFVVEESTMTENTGSSGPALGLAVFNFSITSSTGAHQILAAFDGDATYEPSNVATATAMALMRPTNFEIPPPGSVSAYIDSVFTSTAVLKDIDALTVEGKEVVFTLEGVPSTSITDFSGVATATFTVTSSTGDYVIDVAFNGDDIYSSTSTTIPLSVQRRPTNLISSGDVDTQTLEVFAATVTLRDFESLDINGADVRFVFENSTFNAVTDSFGVAIATFSSPVSSGTYSVQVFFDGDFKYEPSETTISVNVQPRPSEISAVDIVTKALDIFASTATLYDKNEPATKIANKSLTFDFGWSASSDAVTNGIGVATVSYNATSSAGTYVLTVSFAGDATYAASQSTASLQVLHRDSEIVGEDVFAKILDVFVATATFYDSVTLSTVSDRTIKFKLDNGTPVSSITNEIGVATVTFTAPVTSGTYTLEAIFNGDATYNPSSYTSSVTLINRDSELFIDSPETVIINTSFTVTATLSDAVSLEGVSSKIVSFLFQGSTFVAVTDSYGVATATYTASTSSGTYEIAATFDGDASYNASSGSETINAISYPTYIEFTPVSTVIDEVFTATATLMNIWDEPVVSKEIKFTFEGEDFYSMTDSNGVAVSTYTAPLSSGSYFVSMVFDGDALYASTNTTGEIFVDRRPTEVSLEHVVAKTLTVFTATATLTDLLKPSQILVGFPVKFEFANGVSTDVTVSLTGGNGVAVATFTAPSEAGNYLLTASFDGNSTYDMSSASDSVSIIVSPTEILLEDAVSMIDETFIATATLLNADTLLPISTKTIDFSVEGDAASSQTDDNGVATALLTSPSSSGTYTITADFGGDLTYAASSSTSALTVNRRPSEIYPQASSGIVNAVFTTTATIVDGINSNPIEGRFVDFVFEGDTFTALSDVNGIAVATFTAPSSSGTYLMDISFGGDEIYESTTVVSVVNILRRPSEIFGDTVTVRAQEILTATATLTDSLNSDPVSGRAVDFVFEGSTFTILSDINGVAVATFTAPSSSGTYLMDISFGGDEIYESTATVVSVEVLRRLLTIQPEDMIAKAMDVFTATVTLVDTLNPAVMVADKPVVFEFEGDISTPTSNISGIAASTFTAPVSSGTYSIYFEFAGDSEYEPSSSSGNVTVLPRPTTLLLEDATSYPYETFVASATLKDAATLSPVNDASLLFDLDGDTQTAYTDGSGIATTTYNSPETAGNYQLNVDFKGNATYDLSSGSATLVVLKRPTNFSALDSTATAMDVFVTSATLFDSRTSLPVSSKTVIFTFETQSSTAVTDANGLAAASFDAPISSGVYLYQVEFEGDSVYDASNDTGTVYVLPRESKVITLNTTANTNEPFSVTATLVDPAMKDTTYYYIPNAEIIFEFTDKDGLVLQSTSAVTDDVGFASATFMGPSSPASYYYNAIFEGNYTYSASSGTALVKVGILTSLVAFDVETYTLKDFIVKAKLSDSLAELLNDKIIRFTFLGEEKQSLTGATGEDGIAVSSFTAPASSGTYIYTAEFDGDDIYSASNATGTLKVLRRPSSILPYTVNAPVYSTFTATISLKDVIDGNDISLRWVTFSFNEEEKLAETNEFGVASADFFAPLSSGTYNYIVQFNGDDTYAESIATGTVNLELNSTTLIAYDVPGIIANSTFAAKVVLKDDGNQPVSGGDIKFEFGANIGYGITDAGGVAKYVFTAPSSSGTYAYTADFLGNSRYSQSSSSAVVTVGPRSTALFASNVSTIINSTFTVEGRLVDVATQSGIEGKTLTFVFEGSTKTAVTDELGISTVSYYISNSTGIYNYTVEFAGDEVEYSSSDSSATITVANETTTLEAKENIDVKIYEEFDVDAVLKNSVGLQLEGFEIVFDFEGSSATSVTNEVGKATHTFSTLSLVSTGTYNYSAEFLGDTNYVASSDTSNPVNVLQRDTIIQAMDVQVVPDKDFVAQAKLSDNVNGSQFLGQPISSRTVTFEFYCGTSTYIKIATTSETGVSSVTFTSPGETGEYTFVARFDGDEIYMGSVSSATVYVLPESAGGTIETEMDARDVDAYINTTFIASATLTASYLPVPDKPVLFEYFNGADTYTALGYTDSLGIATAAFTAPSSSGVYNYSASFTGDETYAAALDTAAVTVSLFPSDLSAVDVVVTMGDDFLAQATLTDALTSLPLSSQSITFTFFNGVSTATAYVVTNDSGVAVTTFTANGTLGDHFYTAYFGGNSLYSQSVATGSVLIASQGLDAFLVAEDVFTGINEVFNATATLTSGGYPVADKAITFTFETQVVVSTTNDSGIASCEFTAPSSSGVYVYDAVFDGDATYGTAAATAAVQAVIRKEPLPPDVESDVEDEKLVMSWQPVSQMADEIKGYAVEKTSLLRGNWQQLDFISTSAVLSYSATIDSGTANYFRIKTVLEDTQESQNPVIIEVPADWDNNPGNINYVYMSEDANAWVRIPRERVLESSITLSISKESVPDFVLAYRIVGNSAFEGTVNSLNPELRKGIKITMCYESVKDDSVSVAAARQIGIYWYNGVEWIKLGGETDVISKTCSVYSKESGKFALKFTPLASSFSLTKVTPKIFSPNESNSVINRVVFTFENPENKEITIRIFDITGAAIRKNLEWVSSSSMAWDGRDESGNIVKGGIYIYQIEVGNSVLTGTVVVAK